MQYIQTIHDIYTFMLMVYTYLGILWIQDQLYEPEW